MRFFCLAGVVLVGALVTAGCGDDDVPETPVAPDLPTVTDKFEGRINKNGAATHNFITARLGRVSATLTSLTPNEELIVGFGLGTWNGSACNIVLANDKAAKATVIYGNVNASGELCVRVYDVGNVIEETSYEVNVEHP
jgi:hypothetical protein